MLMTATIKVELPSFCFALSVCVRLAREFPNVMIIDCTYKVIKYVLIASDIKMTFFNSIDRCYFLFRFKMPMLHVTGVSSSNDSFWFASIFLSSEQEEDYNWALNHVKSIFIADQLPHVVVADREIALIAALRMHFSIAHNLLCIWHI